ncbi:MAG: transcription-repair coupling factor [Rhizobiaceae bacterium]
MSLIEKIGLSNRAGGVIVDGVADGYEAFAVAAASAELAPESPLVFVARDGQRLGPIAEALAFVAPGLPVLELPAWDCLPYDRVSPGGDAAARRLDALAGIIELVKKPHRAVILTTANATLQRIPPQSFIAAQTFRAKPGNTVDMNALVARLERSGFERVPTVRDVGEFAVRGGILDLFAPGAAEPLRLDFFGDTLESVRAFDAASQRTVGQRNAVILQPMSEVALTPETISRFRRAYIGEFGAPSRDDVLYTSISEGRRFAGMEHWLPLFHEELQTLFSYLPDAPVVFDHLAKEAMAERHKLILDHYDARSRQADGALKEAVPYKPVKPELMYLSPEEVSAATASRPAIELTPFDTPGSSAMPVKHAGAHAGRSFEQERADPSANVFDAVVAHIVEQRNKRRVLVAGWTEGSLDRLSQILAEHHLGRLKRVGTLAEAEKLDAAEVGLAVLPLEAGFETARLVVVAEQDVLGDRLVRRTRKRRAADFIAEASSLSAGDIVVHADHGIGRFIGLQTITAAGAPHDCLEIHYASDGKLYLPVENIELLSRYGSDGTEVALDKLGGGAWQSRKAKLKRRLLEMAGQLIRLAAERHMRPAPAMRPADGIYGEFAARFPYDETDDQQTAIDSVIDDLGAGKPMDRLVCGDVGFGKTEVALRAAFVAAMEGFQVAVVVPTTLLARQHFRTFSQRFAGLPVRVRQASRLVGAKELAETKKGLTDGTVDIVVGTHALLGSAVSFKNLGLLIIDEEQHFGVKHKERLKELKSDVHVLTLSATPIPRTLQLALTGVRELSLITTPPVDRMAVRTFISPFDPLVIRETLLRERDRGGHSFYVVPRISDLEDIHNFLKADVPEL